MKKLNSKGFTLVELLAVIVILALLIVIVANTAIPAMNNAKKKSLETFAQKVLQKAKENCAAQNMSNMGNNMCNGKDCCSKLTVAEIMGESNSTYTGCMDADYTNSMGKIADGCISDGTNYVTIDATTGALTKGADKNTTFTAGASCPTTKCPAS